MAYVVLAVTLYLIISSPIWAVLGKIFTFLFNVCAVLLIIYLGLDWLANLK